MNKQIFSSCGKRKSVRTILLLLFTIVSLFFISPAVKQKQKDYHSSQLYTITKREGNTERTDYTDSEGRITDAADLGYSTVVVTRTEKGELEQYYNSQGVQAYRRYSGQYAVYREYDEGGRIIYISFRDKDGNPMVTSEGYATEKREYSGRTAFIRYYDTKDQPINTLLYGYGRISEYNDNGKNYKTTYIDQVGKPMTIQRGYATVTREYYTSDSPENGKVKNEFYYDEDGNPVALSLGQYGVYKRYDENGREAILTYLDAEGNPIISNKGYSTVVRTFQANNQMATEQYYDLDGKPFALSEGQYGVKKEDGRTVYLNEDGKEIFNIKNLMYNHSRIIIPFALFFIIICTLLDKRWNIMFLVICIFTICYFTLMYRYDINTRQNELFWSYKTIITDSKARSDILKNIWLFIPLGAILYQLYPKKIVLFVPITISIINEGIQFFSGIGFCEIDDVISNGLGGWLGYIFAIVTKESIPRIQKQRQISN